MRQNNFNRWLATSGVRKNVASGLRQLLNAEATEAMQFPVVPVHIMTLTSDNARLQASWLFSSRDELIRASERAFPRHNYRQNWITCSPPVAKTIKSCPRNTNAILVFIFLFFLFFYFLNNQISYVFANVCIRSSIMEVKDVYLHDANVTSGPGTCTPPKGRKEKRT